MIPLTTISLAKVGNSEGEWITSNFDVRALVSLAYSKVGGDNVDRIGLSLTPISKIFMNNNELKIEEVNGGMTFQDILQNSQVRYYIPPMVIRYKLF
jgi:hypothetical protein